MQIISPVREKFFPNRENSSAQSAVEPLRATAGMPGDAPMARLYDLMRAREHYIILGIFSCRPRPCGTPYQRGRDATCCVRKTEDELAGQARKDTDSEGFADNIQIGASEVM